MVIADRSLATLIVSRRGYELGVSEAGLTRVHPKLAPIEVDLSQVEAAYRVRGDGIWIVMRRWGKRLVMPSGSARDASLLEEFERLGIPVRSRGQWWVRFGIPQALVIAVGVTAAAYLFGKDNHTVAQVSGLVLLLMLGFSIYLKQIDRNDLDRRANVFIYLAFSVAVLCRWAFLLRH